MGCGGSSVGRDSENFSHSILKKRNSNWNFTSEHNMKSEDWTEVISLWNVVRAQGAEMDITTFAFEKVFAKNPQAKVLFVDAGILDPVEEFKNDPRFRAHMREISTGLNKIIDLKTTDATGFQVYVQDIWETHSRIKRFQVSYFELFTQSFHECVIVLMGPLVSRKQIYSLRKFSVFLYKTLAENMSSPPEDEMRMVRQN